MSPRKRPHAATATASCSVTPDPCPWGQPYTVTGSGIVLAGYLNVFVHDRVGVQAYMPPLVDGAFTLADLIPAWDGLHTVEVRDYDANTGAVTVLATCSFEVVTP